MGTDNHVFRFSTDKYIGFRNIWNNLFSFVLSNLQYMVGKRMYLINAFERNCIKSLIMLITISDVLHKFSIQTFSFYKRYSLSYKSRTCFYQMIETFPSVSNTRNFECPVVYYLYNSYDSICWVTH